MTARTRTLFARAPLIVALFLLVLPLLCEGQAWALYPPDGTKPDGAGGYMNPGDGMCVVGIKLDGTMLVDWDITNARDCVAYTKSADGTTNLVGMTTQAACQNATNPVAAPNDGYRHGWSTSICYDVANSKGISRVDLDNTDSMCFSKGGTVVTTGKCVAYGWVYRNRKADNTLPISGTGVSTTDGVQSTDNLGFCATSMRMTSGTFTSATTCPSKHNSRANADPVGGPYIEWPTCASSTTGCQTQASYDAGLGWSFSSPACLYSYGVNGIINAAATKADGNTYAAGTTQDLTLYTNQGDCLANGFSWDNWLPVSGTTTKDNTSGGEYAGMPAGAVIRKLDALTKIEDGGGEFYSGTGAVCLKCHSDQSRAYMERYKPGFPKTRHKLAGDATGKPFKPFFTEAGSDWGLQGVQCAMCHSTAKPAQDDLIQVVPAGVVGPPAAGAPKSATGHNQTEYGSHLVSICYTCHGTPATPMSTNPASVIPVTAGDFTLTAYGLAPIANQFLNGPHAEYGGGGTSSKVDVGNRLNYGSSFIGYSCRTAAGKLSSTTYPTLAACQTTGGYTWYATTVDRNFDGTNDSFCYYNSTTCTSKTPSNTGEWTTSYVTAAYPWAADPGGPGGVCKGVGIGSIITTVYRNDEAEKIPNLDSTINLACTSAGDGGVASGAAGFWVKDGETSPGTPGDTAQGTCMTCHDVHWALADEGPEAEPLRRECTTCHENPGASASSAPPIHLSSINHLAGAGTPLENAATDPAEACEICHMPPSSASGSFMHLWRISTDPNYVTMGTSQVNLAPDGSYTDAGWVDLDRACGQCHGGSGSAKPGVPYFTKTQLAAVAKGIHDSSANNYQVSFGTHVAPGTPLTVDADATVNCGGTCPPLEFVWDWGDSTSDSTLDASPSHTYAAAGPFTITLIAKKTLDHLEVGRYARTVRLTNPDLPPVASGSCAQNADKSWTATDTSVDDGPDPDTTATDGTTALKVVVNWGDGGNKSVFNRSSLASASHTYVKAGNYTVTATVIDTIQQSGTWTCPVTASLDRFTISGTVTDSHANPAANAIVKVIRTNSSGSTTVVRKVFTDTLGVFTTDDGATKKIKPGTYKLKVAKSGYTFPAPITITVPPDSTANTIQAITP